jgi:hypothetical protein
VDPTPIVAAILVSGFNVGGMLPSFASVGFCADPRPGGESATSRTPGSLRTYLIRSNPSPSAPPQTHANSAQPIRTRRSQTVVT